MSTDQDTGRVAVITGGSSGIGEATARGARHTPSTDVTGSGSGITRGRSSLLADAG